MKLRQVLVSVLILIPLAVPAQDSGKGLSFDLSYMTRGEIRNGGLLKGDESADDFAAFLLGRTRLGLKYEGQGISSRLTAQHSGTWGSQGGGTLGIYEAWVQLQSRQGLFVRVGRQNLSYDDQRIFGSDDFSMTGMSHDVLKAGFEGNGHKFHVFAAFNQNGENTSGGGTYFSGGYQPYKAMESAWYHYDFKRIPLGASLLFLNLGMQGGEKGEDNARTWQQQLAGTYLSFKPKGWSFEGAFYYQMGKSEYGIPIEAWMASSKVTANRAAAPSASTRPGCSCSPGKAPHTTGASPRASRIYTLERPGLPRMYSRLTRPITTWPLRRSCRMPTGLSAMSWSALQHTISARKPRSA